MDIDFSGAAPHKEQIVFYELPAYRGNYSTYIDGILFVNGTACTKGEALVAFFEQANFYPKKIIFVDDRENNLKTVEEAIQNLPYLIEYHGVHYVGAKDSLSQFISEAQFETRWQELAEQAKAMK